MTTPQEQIRSIISLLESTNMDAQRPNKDYDARTRTT